MGTETFYKKKYIWTQFRLDSKLSRDQNLYGGLISEESQDQKLVLAPLLTWTSLLTSILLFPLSKLTGQRAQHEDYQLSELIQCHISHAQGNRLGTIYV